ncbi:MAG TPA: LytR family transcriptional regulator, partial [Pedococcus sp.]|nr:LytR family transcriptional regulator [Pedococcus sp.]
YGDEGDLAAALLQEHVPRAQLVKDSRAGTGVDLVIGNAYTALTDPANVPPLAPRAKPVAPTVARPCQ